MMKYKIPTYEYLQLVSAPISVLHGTDDGVIPYSNSVRLREVLKPTDEFITIDGGSHNDLDDFPLFHQKLDSLLMK
jgi:pimeloyl-ACP methyl ester carboxylesterase